MRRTFIRGIVAGLVVAAIAVAGAEELRNGGFETVGKDGAPEGWTCFRKPFSLAKGEGRGGGTALFYEAGEKPPYIVVSQEFPARSGRSYRVTGWARTENLRGGRAKLCIEWYGKTGKWMGGAYEHGGVSGTSGWTEMSAMATRLPSGAKTTRIGVYVEKGGVGRAWFDDIKLEPVVVPMVAGVYSSAYRNKAAKGKVSFFADLNLAADDTSGGDLSAEFSLPFAECRRSVAANVAEGWASVSVDAEKLCSGRVEFRLKDRAGKLLGEAALTFERLAREPDADVYVDLHNRLIVDGKPFFPLGMYWGQVTAKELDEYAKGPFNCLMPYSRINREQLDLCAARGLKAFCNIKDLYSFVRRKGVTMTAAEASEKAREVIEDLRGHPALLGWYLNDEIGPEYIGELTARQRQVEKLDPRHPTWTMLYQVRQMRAYLPAFDICGSDPYPHDDWKRWSDPFTWPKMQVDGTFGSRPVWQAVQAHDSAAYMPPGREKQLKTHPTTIEELRSMTWQALAAGANGLFFYSFFDLKKMDWKTPFAESFGNVCRVAEEVKRFQDVLMSPDTAAVSADTPDLGVRSWWLGGTTYLAVANLVHGRTQGRVRAEGCPGGAETLLGVSPTRVDGEWLYFDMDAFGVSFVRLSPPSMPSVRVDVDSTHPTHAVSRDMYGLFLEDISLSVDGCFYPELVWNRGFDFPSTNSPGPFAFSPYIQGWREDHGPQSAGRVGIRYAKPKFENTPAYLRIEAFSAGAGTRNDGPMGEMSVRASEPLALSLWARGDSGFTVALVDRGGVPLAAPQDFPASGEWKRFEAEIAPTSSVRNAALRIRAARRGTLDLEQVSLGPKRRFKGRRDGLRSDIAQLMADLKPATFRFPGGCMLEGNSFESWFDWKRTIGPAEERMPIWNIWGYYQTLGVGYYEYLQFCEDIGAKPVPVFLAGMTCQLRRPATYAPMAATGLFTSNVLDAIEFARGGADTRWGRVRAEMGHPAPFTLEYVAIGNENRFAEYYDRYDEMALEIRRRFPDIKLVASVDPAAHFNAKLKESSWARISKATADVADEHIYGSPSWWLNNARLYDSYPRKGVAVYVGEWATRNASDTYINSMYNAVCEAAFRMGFERNADLVKMSAYAPLIRRMGFPGNRYALIRLGGTSSCGTPAYWCERMFAENRPDRVVPVAHPDVKWMQPAGIDRPKCRDCGNPEAKAIEVSSFHAAGGVTDGGDLVLKFANAAFRRQPVEVSLGAKVAGQKVVRTRLCAAPDAHNTPEDPHVVVPRKDEIPFEGGEMLSLVLEPCSVTVLRIALPR